MEYYDYGLIYNKETSTTAAEAQRCGYELIAIDYRSSILPRTEQEVILDELPKIPFKNPEFFKKPGFVPPFPPPTQAKMLTRFTYIPPVSESSFTLGPPTAQVFKYDIIAVEPGNQKCFEFCCLTSKSISIVVIPERPPFSITPKTIRGAIKRGVFIEVRYANALRSGLSRREFTTNLRTLIRVTKGIGLLVSSGANNRLDIRRPLEVCCMLQSIGGATHEQARRIIGNGKLLVNCSTALKAMDSIALIDTDGPEYVEADEPISKRWQKDGLGDFIAF